MTTLFPPFALSSSRTPLTKEEWRTSLLESRWWSEAQAALALVPEGDVSAVQVAVSKLEHAIRRSVDPYQPLPHPDVAPKLVHVVPPIWSVLEGEVSALRVAVRTSHDAAAARAPLLEAWESACTLASQADYDLRASLSDSWDQSNWDNWRGRISAACGSLIKEGHRRRNRMKTSAIRFFIKKRHVEALLAEEGTSGMLRRLLRNIGRPENPPISPKQVRTANKGGSTDYRVVLKETRLCHLDWTRSRKSRPAGGAIPEWLRAMYRLDPLPPHSPVPEVSRPPVPRPGPAVVGPCHSPLSDSAEADSSSTSLSSNFSLDADTSQAKSTDSPHPNSPQSWGSSPGGCARVASEDARFRAPPEGCFSAPAFPSLDITEEFSFEEFWDCLKLAKDGAPGPSGISNGLLRALPHEVLLGWHSILARCLSLKAFPPSFLLGHIYTMPKPGEPSLQNCRPISLMECSLKVLTRILNRRLMDGLLKGGVFSALQSGFIVGREGTDPVYIVKGALEDARERNIHLYLLLLDLERAFDSVEAWSLEWSYRWAGLTEDSVRMLSALDGKGTARVITPFGLTDPHVVWRGVRQGETLSPTKFILWLEPWLRHAKALYGHYGHTLRGGARLSHQAMADDIAILTVTPLGMQVLAESCGRFMAFHAVTISAKKTVLCSSSKTGLVITFPVLDRASTPEVPRTSVCRLRADLSNKPHRYLGDRVSVHHRWCGASAAMSPVLQFDVGALAKKRIGLAEALDYYSAVTLGKGGYFLPMARITATQLGNWDRKLRRIFARKAGMAPSGSGSQVHASKPAGLGVTSISTLAIASGLTELLKRLCSPGLLGQVARSRWEALQPLIPTLECLGSLSPASLRFHHTGHILRLAWREGFEFSQFDQFKEYTARLSSEGALEDLMAFPPLSQMLPRMRRSPFRTLEDVRLYVGSTPAPPPPGRGPRPPGALLPHVFRFCSDLCRAIKRRCHRCPKRSGLRGRRTRTRVKHSWCWTVWDALLKPGSPISVRRKGLDGLCPFLTSVSRSPGPLLSGEPLILASDGSLYEAGEGAFAIISLDVDDPRIRHWPLRSQTLENGDKVVARCQDIAVSSAGQERLEIGFLELLAALWLGENGPLCPTVLQVDASYIISGLDRIDKGMSTLRWVRLDNAPIWRRLTFSLKDRARRLAPLSFQKCSAHGRDALQDELITRLNSTADSRAKTVAKEGPYSEAPFVFGGGMVSRSLLEGGFLEWKASCAAPFLVSVAGRAFRSDPRKGVRRVAALRALDHWCSLRVEGSLARVVKAGNASVPTTKVLRSRRCLNALGAAEAHDLLFCLRAQSVRDASRMFRSDQGYWPLLSLNQGRPLCALCEGNCPDPIHTGLECPPLESTRHTVRTVVASLLAGSRSLVQPVSTLEETVGDWIRDAFHLPDLLVLPLLGAVRPLAPSLLVGVPFGGYGPAPKPTPGTQASRLKKLLWLPSGPPVFLLLPGSAGMDTVVGLSKMKVPVSIMLAVNRGSWPSRISSGGKGQPTWFHDDSVLLLAWGCSTLLPSPSPHSIVDLSHLLSERLWMGTLGLTFQWGRLTWPLDAVDRPDLQEVLDPWHLLPGTPAPRPTHPDDCTPQHTWLGLLPSARPAIFSELLGEFPSRGKQLWATLGGLLSAGLGMLHAASRSLTAQSLSFRKRCAIARFKGRSLPSRRPPFHSWEGSKAMFPPSVANTRRAVAYFTDGGSVKVTSASVQAYALREGIPPSSWSSLHLAVAFTASRLGPAGLAGIAPLTTPPPPPMRLVCVPPPCQACASGSRPALLRCPGCATPRYCSAKCRKDDWDAHGSICISTEQVSQLDALPVRLLTRSPESAWAMMVPETLRALRPIRHPRLHPSLALIYIEEGDSLFPFTSPPQGGMTTVQPSGKQEVVEVGLSPASPGGSLLSEADSGDSARVCKVSPCSGETRLPHLLDVPQARTAETHALAWRLWLSQPALAVVSRGTRLAEGPSLPISFATLSEGRDVGDMVMDLTLTHLAHYCGKGVALSHSLSLDILLASEDIQCWWDGLKGHRVVLLPIIQHNHWFLLRLLPGVRVCYIYNSAGSFGERGSPARLLSSLPHQAGLDEGWTLIRSISPQQTDSSSCALFVLLHILRFGLGPPRLPSPIPSVWVRHFRLHWLHFLLLEGAAPSVAEDLLGHSPVASDASL